MLLAGPGPPGYVNPRGALPASHAQPTAFREPGPVFPRGSTMLTLPRALLTLLLGLVVSTQGLANDTHLLLGNPSKATADETNKDNFLMKKEFFALSYNNKKGTPNWVSWVLTKDTIGDKARPRK